MVKKAAFNEGTGKESVISKVSNIKQRKVILLAVNIPIMHLAYAAAEV